MNTTDDLYIDLMKKCLLNIPYLDVEANPIMPRGRIRPLVLKAFEKIGVGLIHTGHTTVAERLAGVGHTSIAHTMISMDRLENLQWCVETVLAEETPGDFIETGVLRGGAVIFMAALLKAHGDTDRKVWVADSFEGLPAPSPGYPADADAHWHEFLGGAVSLEEIKARFARYDLLSDQIVFLKGWFKDTLPQAPIEQLSILRLDGDMYESTMDALVSLYPKLVPGGFLIIDDYDLREAHAAVIDYRVGHDITTHITGIDGAGAYWQKEG